MTPFTLQHSPLLIALIVLFLFPSLALSSASAMCSELYGQPLQQDCWQMLFGPHGITSDTNSHLFSLPLRHRPPNILNAQWRTKQRLPYLRSYGDCRLALLAIQLVDHTTTYDTSTWASVIVSGSLIYNQCVALVETEGGVRVPSGGYVITGDHHRLALLLYASGSVYDQQVQSDIANGRSVVAEQDPGGGIGEDMGTNTTTANLLINLLHPILP